MSVVEKSKMGGVWKRGKSGLRGGWRSKMRVKVL